MKEALDQARISERQYGETLQHLHIADSLRSACGGAELVIEAITEDREAKASLLGLVAKLVPEGAIVTSNSSSISISCFSALFPSPERLANLHFFDPVAETRLVEIGCGERTSMETREALQSFVRQLGKTYIMVYGEVEGFVVERLLRAVQDEACFLVESGAAAFEDVDKGAELGLNYPMGPFRLMDLMGLDRSYCSRLKKYQKTGDERDKPPRELEERFKAGYYGRKTGKGWYTYPE